MTIAAIGTRGTEARDLYIPVATEHFFRTYWLRAAAALDLELVPIFGSPGLDVDVTNRDGVVKELDDLVAWSKDNVAAPEHEHLATRAASLRSLLMRIAAPSLECVYIG